MGTNNRTMWGIVQTLDRLFGADGGIFLAMDGCCHWETEYIPKYWPELVDE